MEKEFDLSKKIKCVEAGAVSELPLGTDYDYEMIFTKDFKEFIRLLKEEFGNCRDKTDVWADEERWDKFERMFEKKLNKLAGKELSK